MRFKRGHAAAVTVLAAVAATGLSLGRSDAAAVTPVANPSSAAHTVTLITGDRVTVSAAGNFAVEPGPGRAGLRFATQGAWHLSVVRPTRCRCWARAGSTPPFDVTADRRRVRRPTADLPLIVAQPATAGPRSGGPPAVRRAARGAGPARRRRCGGAGGQASRRLDLERHQIAGSRPGRAQGVAGRAVAADPGRQRAADRGARGLAGRVHRDRGDRGRAGQRHRRHPPGPGRQGRGAAQLRGAGGRRRPRRPRHARGLHDRGSGAASGGRYKGVAPAPRSRRQGLRGAGCAESWIIAGMQWAVAEQHARIVNMSLGGPDS